MRDISFSLPILELTLYCTFSRTWRAMHPSVAKNDDTKFCSASLSTECVRDCQTSSLAACSKRFHKVPDLEKRTCPSPLDREPRAPWQSKDKPSTAPHARDARYTLKAAQPAALQPLAMRHTSYREERREKLEHEVARCLSAMTRRMRDA